MVTTAILDLSASCSLVKRILSICAFSVPAKVAGSPLSICVMPLVCALNVFLSKSSPQISDKDTFFPLQNPLAEEKY